MNNAEEFLSIFNEIEQIIYKKVGASSHRELSSMLSELYYEKKDRIVIQFRDDLREYTELRNAIVHQSRNLPIADPYPETIESLRTLKNSLLNPRTARNIMTSPVISFDSSDNLSVRLKEMAVSILTNVPVYESGELVGVLSEQSCVKWLADNYQEDGFITSALLISDIKEYLEPTSGGVFDIYSFIKSNTDIYTIMDMFDNAIRQGKRLSSVFVTEHGKPDETLLGIITAWDLHKS